MSLKEKLKQIQQDNEEDGNNDPNVIKQRLMTGYYGLVKIFWLLWFIPILLLNIGEALSSSTGTMLRIDIITLVWSTLCLIFVSKTQANKVWKVIALIVIALDVVLSALALLTFM